MRGCGSSVRSVTSVTHPPGALPSRAAVQEQDARGHLRSGVLGRACSRALPCAEGAACTHQEAASALLACSGDLGSRRHTAQGAATKSCRLR